ncbi:hypothetical protein KDL01_04570 [Actinospica durhamensis]|uniref:Uncharacterized protein n=1 Tax=Actinospica durhamensis TaxID=1508375 RepID=A0A941ELG0_9ACTN|nr:hypothetical protein [Actinospica durhamensis]MBR7832518.1 hypothetical protein [Actinospica durhamensis]
MLIARSSPECRLYMDLHACSCGETGFAAEHALQEDAQGRLLAVYSGLCPRCGLPRQFVFALDDAIPPPPPAFGGAAASRIVDPGEFLLYADKASAAAGFAPDAGDAGDPQAGERGRLALAAAAAAVDEVLKFIPQGAAAVPEAAFTSATGRALYAREPGRFSKVRLEATAASHRAALAGYRAA